MSLIVVCTPLILKQLLLRKISSSTTTLELIALQKKTTVSGFRLTYFSIKSRITQCTYTKHTFAPRSKIESTQSPFSWPLKTNQWNDNHQKSCLGWNFFQIMSPPSWCGTAKKWLTCESAEELSTWKKFFFKNFLLSEIFAGLLLWKTNSFHY